MGLGTRTLCRAREHFTFSMIASILDLVTCANSGDLTMAAMRSIRKLALFWAQYLQRTVFALPLWHHKPVPNDPSLEFRGEKGFEQRRALARTLGAVDEWDVADDFGYVCLDKGKRMLVNVVDGFQAQRGDKSRAMPQTIVETAHSLWYPCTGD